MTAVSVDASSKPPPSYCNGFQDHMVISAAITVPPTKWIVHRVFLTKKKHLTAPLSSDPLLMSEIDKSKSDELDQSYSLILEESKNVRSGKE